LPKGTASGLEVQTSAEETDFIRSLTTGGRRISPNDPKIIVREHHEKANTLIAVFNFQRAIFSGVGPDFRSSPFGLRCGFGYITMIIKLTGNLLKGKF